MHHRLFYDARLKSRARELRNNMTDAEILLWSRLRMNQVNGLRFYRQRIIAEYIVDFYCPKARLVIEVDGGQHFLESGARSDMKRDEILGKHGVKVIRYSDTEVLEDVDAVMESIWALVANNPP